MGERKKSKPAFARRPAIRPMSNASTNEKQSSTSMEPNLIRRRVLLVDDHPAVLEGLRSSIDRTAELTICGEATNVVEAMAQVATLNPDVVLVDLSLRDSKGMELIEDLHARYSGKLLTVVLSVNDETLYAERALQAGARGYVMKQASMKTIVEAIHKVLDGNIYLSEAMTTRLTGSYARRGDPIEQRQRANGTCDAVDSLSNRELEVFRFISEGHSTRQIAEMIHLSKKTVSCYQQNIRKKLDLKNASELIRHAVHWAVTNCPKATV